MSVWWGGKWEDVVTVLCEYPIAIIQKKNRGRMEEIYLQKSLVNNTLLCKGAQPNTPTIYIGHHTTESSHSEKRDRRD